MKRRLRVSALALFASALLGGCGGSNSADGGVSDGAVSHDAGPSAEAQACLDTADAVAKAAVRCMMGDYQSNYNAFIQSAAKGDCANIIMVRDIQSLRATCIPSLMTISCMDLAAANLDASCKAQLEHT